MGSGRDALPPAPAVVPAPRRPLRLAIAALSALGLGDALYMLAYEEGLLGSLICPFFGEGCNIVGRSPQARHFGIPNAAAGAVAYGVLAALALWPARGLVAGAWRTRALRGIAAAAVAASAVLVWEQATKVRAWCFWCLSSAVINAALLLLSLAERPAGLSPAGRDTPPEGKSSAP